jgi:hypothetical protein
MKFLADENLETSVVEALRLAGHDVATVPGQAGTRDSEVLTEIPTLADSRSLG